MRSSRSRMPSRLRPNGERTSDVHDQQRDGEEGEDQKEERHLVGEVDAEIRPAADS